MRNPPDKPAFRLTGQGGSIDDKGLAATEVALPPERAGISQGPPVRVPHRPPAALDPVPPVRPPLPACGLV